MALITDMGDALKGGILMPMLKNKWRIDAVSILTEDELQMLTVQAISLKYKFKSAESSQFGFQIKHRHDVMLVVEECINGKIAPIAAKLMQGPFDLSYVHLDGDISILKTTTFKNCTAVGYEYNMDYAASEACKYPMKFTCEEIVYS